MHPASDSRLWHKFIPVLGELIQVAVLQAYWPLLHMEHKTMCHGAVMMQRMHTQQFKACGCVSKSSPA